VVVINFTPVVRDFYRLGVPQGGWYQEVLNTDSALYGGGDIGMAGGCEADPIPWHGQSHSLGLRLPPLAALYLRPQPR
jgi:1,4-alpha-glucan branching enzyme